MTPKEKAIYLYLMYKQRTHYVEVFHTPYLLDKFHNNAIECAIIAVDMILDISKIASLRRDDVYMELEYWLEVKQELEKI